MPVSALVPGRPIGMMSEALTMAVDGKPLLVIPREPMLELMVRIGVAARGAIQLTGAAAASLQRATLAALRDGAAVDRSPRATQKQRMSMNTTSFVNYYRRLI